MLKQNLLSNRATSNSISELLVFNFTDITNTGLGYGETNTQEMNTNGTIYVSWPENCSVTPYINGSATSSYNSAFSFNVNEGDEIYFRLSAAFSRIGTATLKNNDNSGVVLDTFSYDIGGVAPI